MSSHLMQPPLSMSSAKKKTPSEETEESMQLTVRVPIQWWASLDAMAKRASVLGLKVTRTDMARRALAIGIEELLKAKQHSR